LNGTSLLTTNKPINKSNIDESSYSNNENQETLSIVKKSMIFKRPEKNFRNQPIPSLNSHKNQQHNSLAYLKIINRNQKIDKSATVTRFLDLNKTNGLTLETQSRLSLLDPDSFSVKGNFLPSLNQSIRSNVNHKKPNQPKTCFKPLKIEKQKNDPLEPHLNSSEGIYTHSVTSSSQLKNQACKFNVRQPLSENYESDAEFIRNEKQVAKIRRELKKQMEFDETIKDKYLLNFGSISNDAKIAFKYYERERIGAMLRQLKPIEIKESRTDPTDQIKNEIIDIIASKPIENKTNDELDVEFNDDLIGKNSEENDSIENSEDSESADDQSEITEIEYQDFDLETLPSF
jgi:hypothetical protein